MFGLPGLVFFEGFCLIFGPFLRNKFPIERKKKVGDRYFPGVSSFVRHRDFFEGRMVVLLLKLGSPFGRFVLNNCENCFPPMLFYRACVPTSW